MTTRPHDTQKEAAHFNGELHGTGGTGLPCAWCLAEQGIAPRNESHGICPRHRRELLAKAHKAGHTHTKSLADETA